MKRPVLSLFFVLSFCPCISAATCKDLAGLTLEGGKITAASVESGEAVAVSGSAPMHNLPSFCRVAATLTPSGDSNIRIEVWMPASGWNGKYEGTGNGGYAGSIQYQDLAAGLRRGYAVANTDMGTTPSTMEDGDVLVGHAEKWRDWGSRSTHEMTVATKQIIRAYYGKEPAFSYFVGCSTGGQQGLVEAQRFPDDYDGILAGAPANNRTRLHMSFLWDLAAARKSPESSIPASKLSLISEAVLNACTAQKAAASDRFLSNPTDCQWDPRALLCKAGDAADCLTQQQIETVRDFYRGPVNPVTRKPIYPGLLRGSEFDWNYLMPLTGDPRFDSLFKWTFGASWNWRTFDFNRDVTAVDARLVPMLNATNPDLGKFKARGHKLIVYHGWADVVVPSLESINYYGSVENAQAAEAASNHRGTVEETQGFYRLFMVPGMAHCSGGIGLNRVDAFDSLELWVEKGIAPEKIVAKRVEKGVTQMARPICPYPQTTLYNGTGDTNDVASFSCSSSIHDGGK
jgi:feruloyl esterase